MSESVKDTTDEKFEKDVLKSELPVLVDFWAEWCAPCKSLVPILEEVAQEYQNQVRFYKVNVDKNQSLAVQFGVRSIPYLLLFKESRVIATEIGMKTKSQLSALLNQHI